MRIFCVLAIGALSLGCSARSGKQGALGSHLLSFEDGRGASASRDEDGRIHARYYESDGTLLSSLSFMPGDSTSVSVSVPSLGCNYQDDISLAPPPPTLEYP